MLAYQLIALDLDGTLLTDEKTITPETVEQLNDLKQDGKYVVIATGRSVFSVRPLLEDYTFPAYYITDNGANVYELDTGRTLHTSTIPRAFLQTMREVMRKYGVHCDVTTDSCVYVEHLDEEGREKYREYHIEPTAIGDLREVPEDPVIFTMTAAPSVLDEVVPRLDQQYGDELKIVRSGEHFIDIMKAGTTKGTALKRLVAHLGLEAEDTLAVGNYYNDLEMLRYAGLGIAMANAPDDLKAEADAVTLSNNEDGVRVALDKWVLQKAQ